MKNIFEKRINILPYEYPSLLAYKDAIRHAYWLHCVGDNQRVVTSEGMFTVKELYEQDKELILFDGVKEVKSSKMIRTGHRSIYRLTTKEGYVHDVTNDHRVLTKDGWKEVKDLVVDDKLIIQTKKGLFGNEHFPELAFLIGHYQGDGHNHGNGYAWHVWSHEYHFIDELELALNKVYSHYDLKGKVPTFGTEHVTSQNVRSRKMISKRIPYTFVKGVVPELVWRGTEKTIKSYLKGLYITDGCVYQSKKHQSIKISQSNYDFICEIQLLLLNLGIKSTVYKTNGGKKLMPDGKGGCDLYNTKDKYTIEVTHYESVKLINDFTNLFESRGKVYREITNPNKSNPIIEARFLSLEYLYDDYVYCVSVDNKEYPAWVCNGFVTHNTEFNFTTDIDDYKTKISNEEREVIKRSMLAIAQIEVSVKTFWADLYKRMPITEIGDVGMTFSESEIRHKDAYAQLLRILGLEDEFKTVIEIPAIKNRINYLTKYLDGTRSKENKMYTKSILLFSLFIEHVSLFSQFLIMMSFNKEKNLFKGISNVVEATSKEEEIHGNFGSELINIIKEENPEWFDEEFEALIVSACNKAYAAECGILDWIFENGELSFLSKDTIKHFIQNRFNNSLNRIGMKPVFEVDFTEIEKTLWFDVEILSTKEGDFFYKKQIDYNKKSKSITEDDLF